jgi:hypothetical protein
MKVVIGSLVLYQHYNHNGMFLPKYIQEDIDLSTHHCGTLNSQLRAYLAIVVELRKVCFHD